MKKKYEKLLNNSIIFFIANFGSKVLTFFMVPYYTYVLSTGEYGTIDVVITITSLLAPLVTMGITDVVLYETIKREQTSEKILTNSFLIVLIGNILITIIYPLLCFNQIFKEYIILLALILIPQTFYSVLQSYVRGSGKTVSYAISGIMYTLLFVSGNILFLSKFRLGIEGYLISMIIAYTVCDIYLLICANIFKRFRIRTFDYKYIKSILKISLPLIPTAFMWWLMNISDKYVVLYFMGPEANGILAVSNKIPTVISTIYSIFQQAWQISTIEEDKSKDRVEMYEKLFGILTALLFITMSGLIVIVKYIIVFLCDKEYYEAWKYVPMLLMAAVYSAISGFIGTNYILMKKTGKAMLNTIISAVVNTMLNILLIPKFGLQGAAIATFIGFLVIVVIRLIETHAYTPMKINFWVFIPANLIIIAQTVIALLELRFSLLINIVLFCALVLLYRQEFIAIVSKLKNMIKKKIQKKDGVG